MAESLEIYKEDLLVLKCDEVLAIQVIPLNTKTRKQLVKSNLHNLAKAYKKIIKPASFYAATYDFFTAESIRGFYLRYENEEGEESGGFMCGEECYRPVDAKINYISAKPLVPREEFKGSDEDYQKDADNFEALKTLKTNNCNSVVKKAIKEVSKGNDFIESLLKEEMADYPDMEMPFLLVCGKASAEIEACGLFKNVQNQKIEKYELGPVSLLHVGNSPLKVGNIEISADLLEAHIAYEGSVSGVSLRQSSELSNPQFQLVNRKLEPLSSLPEEEAPKEKATTQTNSSNKTMTSSHITIEGVTNSSIKTLQIIGVDDHVRNLLLQNAGHVEGAYPEIVKHATEKKSMTDKIRFFSDESDIVAKVFRQQEKLDDDVKMEIIKDIHNLDEKEAKRLEKMGRRGDEVNKALYRFFIGYKNYVWETVRRLLDSGNHLWPYEHYLLVVGEGTNKCSASGSSQYEIPNGDEKGNYDCLQLIGINEDVEVGSLKFKVGILADHIIFNDSINYPNDEDATDSNDKVLSNPQFQLCDCLLNPVDMPEPNSNSLGAKTSNSEESNCGVPDSGHKTVSIVMEGTSSSSIKYLQVIEINKHIEGILKKSAGRVEEAYPEIAEYARKSGKMLRLCFFSNEEEREASVYGNDGDNGSEEIVGRSKVTYLRDLDAYGIKRLLAQFKKVFSDESWVKGTIYGFYNLVAEKLNVWLNFVFRRMVDEKSGIPRSTPDFFDNVIRSAVIAYGNTNRYLLVFGEGHDEYTTSGSSRYEIGIVDDEREYDGHEYIGINEDVEIGSLKFHVDSIADHVFYHGKLYGPHSEDGEYSNLTTVKNPQFQFVNKDFEPIDNPYTKEK